MNDKYQGNKKYVAIEKFYVATTTTCGYEKLCRDMGKYCRDKGLEEPWKECRNKVIFVTTKMKSWRQKYMSQQRKAMSRHKLKKNDYKRIEDCRDTV